MNFLPEQRVLVLGLGASGLAMARWCARHGAQVQVWDSRPQDDALAALQQQGLAVQRLAELPLQQVGGFQLILKSPGLAPHDGRVAPLLQEAADTGVAVLGELDLFARALSDLRTDQGWAPKLLAITGTNGKTTVTAMTSLLVQRTGRRVATAGNIGPTLLDTLWEALQAPQAEWPEVWVLELSSFQLEGGGRGVRGFEPDAATVLNLTQDHLDWHGSMAAYGAAKARVFGQQAVMVLNRDDDAVMALWQQLITPPTPVPAPGSRARAVAKPRLLDRQTLHFSLHPPQRPGDFGLVVEAGMAWLVRALPSEEGGRRGRGAEEELHLQRLMPADALRVRGRHNAANALAALALATAIGCPLAPMLHGLREYAGEPHRLQPVALIDGVEAYDDSKGTNVGATVAALLGLGEDKAPGRLVVILGGQGKGQDFTPLREPLRRHARAVATLGQDAAAIENALQGSGLDVQRFVSLELAVRWGLAQARSGDALLLSPACASLDMFRSYHHRGEVFAQIVREIAIDRGQAA